LCRKGGRERDAWFPGMHVEREEEAFVRLLKTTIKIERKPQAVSRRICTKPGRQEEERETKKGLGIITG